MSFMNFTEVAFTKYSLKSYSDYSLNSPYATSPSIIVPAIANAIDLIYSLCISIPSSNFYRISTNVVPFLVDKFLLHTFTNFIAYYSLPKCFSSSLSASCSFGII
jgi:hypothetical protein